MYYEKDATLDTIKDMTIAVIGYGNQGSAQARNMKDSGLNVIVGLRSGGASWERAEKEGMTVMPVAEAAANADIIHILIPDEVQKKVYADDVAPNLKPGNVLSFSHGFNITFGAIAPPADVDIVMIAPKSPGFMVREVYEEGFGVPALIAVQQDASGKAKAIALAMARAIGSTKAGVVETTFDEETKSDLFGEQVVLCGGVSELVKAGFETLIKNGYQPEIAYFECLHELKLIVDLFYKGGIGFMWDMVSNTAEYGGRTRGSRIITEETRKEMQKILDDIQSGEFAREWLAESDAGMPLLKKAREEEEKETIEVVGSEIRKLFQKP